MSFIPGGENVYVILVNDDNSMTITQKRRIMQRSKLMDELWFLVNPSYSGRNMSNFTVLLEYVLPISRRYCSEILTLSTDKYNGYLKYQLPFDTSLTAEPGNVELQLSFLNTDLDSNGKPKQCVRKTSAINITIVPISAWSDIIPDCALSALDQRIIKMDAQIKAMNETSNMINANKADDLLYNIETNELQLASSGMPIGTKVTLKNAIVEDDNDDTIDFDNNQGENSGDDEDGNEIVEF